MLHQALINSEEFEKKFQLLIKNYLPDHSFSEMINYSLFPGGKYFRANLSYAIAKDLKLDLDIDFIAMFLESHHTYSLIHDDLPAMDNDDVRRGRATSHVKYGEANAILAGDALINISYSLLSNYSKNCAELLKYSTEFLGPKGLILGQQMDLSNESNKSFDALLTMHNLKTARLVQLALILPSIAETGSFNNDLLNYGELIGQNFQLLDDLFSLSSKKLSTHELDINSIIKYKEVALKKLKENHLALLNLPYPTIKEIYLNLYNKRKAESLDSADNISKIIGNSIVLKNYLI